MPMSKDVLGKAIAKIVVASDADASMKAKIEKLWTDIAGEIINHITTQSQIVVAAGIPVATAGSQSAQTGATTSPGTATIS